MRGALEPAFPLWLLLAAIAWTAPSCSQHDFSLLPQTRLKPDAVSSITFNPAAMKRIGVLPFREEEGVQWERNLPGNIPESSEADVAGRFSENIALLKKFEVVPPEKITALLPPDMLEVTTRKQVVELCGKLGLDAVFRGRARMVTERASSSAGGVNIPFAFFTIEVELMEGAGGETVWFAKHHINSFQFIEDRLGINVKNPAAAEKILAEKIPGYPDLESTLTVFGELAISEMAESFRGSFADDGPR